MRNKLILEELNSTPGDLIYKGKNIRIYVDDDVIYASGDNYFKKWYFDDKDSAEKLFKAFKVTGSNKVEFRACLKAFGYESEEDLKNMDYDQFINQLTESEDEDDAYSIYEKDPRDVEKFLFKIQVLDAKDMANSDSYYLSDLPEEVIEGLIRSLQTHPSNDIRIMNPIAEERRRREEEEDDEDY